MERIRAREGMLERAASLAEKSGLALLGEEVIKMSHALVVCGLPYSRTEERQIQRRARIGRNTWINVTFTAGIANVDMPYGIDRRLLSWIIDTSIRTKSALIPWESTAKYCQEMGLFKSGKNYKSLVSSFRRIRGLVVHVQRVERDDEKVSYEPDVLYSIIHGFNLPSSAAGKFNYPPSEGLENFVGIRLNADFFAEIKQHHVVVPRELWRDLDAPLQVQDIAIYLLVRSYAAKSESPIPWDSLASQFAPDSNPRRFRQHARMAIKILLATWPHSLNIRVEGDVIIVGRPTNPILPNDPVKNRVYKT